MIKQAMIIVTVIVVFLSGCKGIENNKSSENNIYLIKEFQDTVIVYKDNNPIMKTKIVLSSLPRTEIMKIKKGIVVNSYQEVEKIIEMYES